MKEGEVDVENVQVTSVLADQHVHIYNSKHVMSADEAVLERLWDINKSSNVNSVYGRPFQFRLRYLGFFLQLHPPCTMD